MRTDGPHPPNLEVKVVDITSASASVAATAGLRVRATAARSWSGSPHLEVVEIPLVDELVGVVSLLELFDISESQGRGGLLGAGDGEGRRSSDEDG
ncbi:unnamed protein product [Clonostachys rosea f. rosea IK726]|uniref:Uncharacterized protein n=1 Tax=Clonostachys rosea f. rosea IK726 TaxID=1349383 RepID=A0ACA9TFG8_BIOOC|nr:unnamed protein product [Clonostachys rosea f. rosea IK726]